ncbi:MAG: sulfatase-like hydrolase/transferase [Rhodoplanes sp.]
MIQRLGFQALRLVAAASLVMIFAGGITRAQDDRTGSPSAGNRPLYNIVFVISDQRSHRLFAGGDYALPAFDAIARRGVSFNNHYIASAMCSPSRASFLTGQPPQVHHVFDQMELG